MVLFCHFNMSSVDKVLKVINVSEQTNQHMLVSSSLNITLALQFILEVHTLYIVYQETCARLNLKGTGDGEANNCDC